MNLSTPFAIALGCTFAAAQHPVKTPRLPQDGPVAKMPAVDPPAAPTLPLQSTPALDENTVRPTGGLDAHPQAQAPIQLPDAVLFDTLPGQVWAITPSWKAGFDANGATFVPFFGSDAPTNHPARFAVTAAQVGGVSLDCTAGAPQRGADGVSIPRGAMVEQYLTSLAGIEQRFVFAQLPARGELTVQIAVDGDYAVTAANGAHRFACDLGSFTYGAATAFDAAGRSAAMTVQYTGGALQLTVPAAFVKQATLPLVIDPMIGNVVSLGSSTQAHATTDIAYDASLEHYVICYERLWSQTDSDILISRCDSQLQAIGLPLFVDQTTTSWRGCRIAGLELHDKFLIVAECGPVGSSWIAGRTFNEQNVTMSVQFDIEHGAIACSHPDVGGDPSPAAPVYWSVVFERHYSTSDHDIMMRQVNSDATLRGAGLTTIDASLAYHHAPVISKSDGPGLPSEQRWCIAYRRDNAGWQTSVYGSYVTWDGQTSGSLPLTGWTSYTGVAPLEVSSPTRMSLGGHFFVVEGIVDPTTQNTVLYGTVIDRNHNQVASRQALTGNTNDRTWPVVETDGSRFVVGCAWATAPGLVHDAYLRTFDRVGGQIQFRDLQLLDYGNAQNPGQSLCALYQSGESYSDRLYASAWNGLATTNTVVRAARYLGMATTGGVSVRYTGCGFGSVSLSSSGPEGALGTLNQVSVGSPVGFTGWVIGLPMSQPIAGCPNCVQGSSAMVTLLTPTAVLNVPYDGAFVGVTFAFQSFKFGPGTCLGSLAFSDTLDLTIR